MRTPWKTTLALAAVLAAAVALPACLCSDEPTDEERLQKQIDTTSVHLYLAVKVALSRTGNDPELAEIRELLLKLTREHAPRTAADGQAPGGTLRLGDLLAGGKALLRLKQIGAEIAANGEPADLQPVLPLLLAAFEAPPEVVAAFDLNTEHALFFVVMSILKAHPKTPVPIPPEILLYEAWHTDPGAVRIPGAAGPLHAMKAWTYGNNDYCDLAAREAAAADATAFGAAEVRRGLALLGGGEGPAIGALDDGELARVDAGIKALAHGGVALCHIERGDDKGARPALAKLIERGRQTGVGGEALAFLEVFVDCGGDDAELQRGLARLTQLEAAAGAPTEDLQLLRAYCAASDETSFEAARKLSLAGKLIDVGVGAARQSGAADQLEQSTAFRAAAGFAAGCQQLAAGGSSVKDALDGITGSAKGLLDKVQGD